MLISVHIPKTAGSSFQQALRDVYSDRLLLDYGDNPLSWWVRHRFRRTMSRLYVRVQCRALMNKYDAIHGHFILSKYVCLAPSIRTAAFFRTPVDRVLSQYQFHQRRPLVGHPLSHAIHIDQLPVDRFICLPQMVHFYRTFLGGWSPDQLDFVGLTEAYEDSLALFERMFQLRLPRYNLNVNEKPDYEAQIFECGGRKEIERLHAENLRLYDLARMRFDELLKQYPG